MTREGAWEKALWIQDRLNHMPRNWHKDRWLDAEDTALRAELARITAEYGFEGTRVDPMVSWVARQGLPWTMPEVAA